MKHILIIDDDVSINDMLEKLLAQEGYTVSHAYSGTEALLFLQTRKPNLILLDLMLPGLSGEEVLPQITDIPVIVMSAKTDVKEKVALLKSGAVDYITKPFVIDELLARILVQFRKQATKPKTLQHGALFLDLAMHEVQVCDKAVRLTRTEFAILKLLMENEGQVVTKTLLLDRVAQDTPDCVESSLRVHISNLRRKLREVSGEDYIEAVWGIGFKLS